MVRGKRAPVKRKTTTTKKTTKKITRKSYCKRSKKYTGTALDEMVEGADVAEVPEKKKESKWKRFAKIGLGMATTAAAGALGYQAYKKIKDPEERAKFMAMFNKGKEKATTALVPYVDKAKATDWKGLMAQGKNKALELYNTAKTTDWKTKANDMYNSINPYIQKTKNWVDNAIDTGLDMYQNRDQLGIQLYNKLHTYDDEVNNNLGRIQELISTTPNEVNKEAVEYALNQVENNIKDEDEFKVSTVKSTIGEIKKDMEVFNDYVRSAMNGENYGMNKLVELYKKIDSLKYNYNQIIH